MIKKIIALAAASLFSLNASAGYLEYELRSPSGVSGGGNTLYSRNYLVIREEDKSVAFFNFNTAIGWFRPSDLGESYHRNYLIETTTSFVGLGPTNIYMRDVQGEEYTNLMWLMFSDSGTAGTYNYSMRVLERPGPYSPYPLLSLMRDMTYTGIAVQVPISAGLENYLNNENVSDIRMDIPYYDPTQVPEPSSVALLALGAAAAAGAASRRKPKREAA